MAKKFLTSLNLAGNQLIDARIENLAAFPASGKAGRLVFNTATSVIALDTGSAFLPLLTSVAWGDVTGKPSTFAPSAHNHAIADVTGLQTALNAKAALASPSFTGNPTVPTQTIGNNSTRAASTAFVQAAVGAAGGGDMLKSVYDTTDNGKVDSAESADAVAWGNVTGKPSTFPATAHGHAIADVTGLQTALDGKAASSHGHAIADVTGLQGELNDKADNGHTHTASEVTDFNAAVDARVIAFIDGEAASDTDIDTLRELMDLVKSNESGLSQVIGRHNETVGNGSATSIAVTHNLNSRDVIVEVYDTGTFETVGVEVVRTSVNVVTITAFPAPASNALRVVVKK